MRRLSNWRLAENYIKQREIMHEKIRVLMHMHESPVAGARVTKLRNMEIMVSETDFGRGNFFLLAQFLRTLLRRSFR